jgi:hypothetical protein
MSKKKPAVYLIVILPILLGGGVSIIAALLTAYSRGTDTAISDPELERSSNMGPISRPQSLTSPVRLKGYPALHGTNSERYAASQDQLM